MSQTSMIQSKEISRFPSKDLREEKNEEGKWTSFRMNVKIEIFGNHDNGLL